MTPVKHAETVKFICTCSAAEFNRFKKSLTRDGRQNRIPFAEEIRKGKRPWDYPIGTREKWFCDQAIYDAARFLEQRKSRTRTVNVPSGARNPVRPEGSTDTLKKPRYAYQNWADPRR